MLLLLGLVEPTPSEAGADGAVQVRSQGAALFLKSMAAHLADDAPLALDWFADLRQPGPAAQGAQILAALEALRNAAVAHPTPVRAITAVNGLMTRRANNQVQLLMQFDDKADQFQLIGGKTEPTDADLQATLVREMQEELERPDLAIPTHFRAALLPQKFEETSLSPTFGVITNYLIHFYFVSEMAFTPHIDENTAWIDLSEVRAGKTRDERRVSELPLMFLHILETYPPSLPG
jgi:8-oxo-dGTP pyrophosphatase MutT (NUDIX family)